MSPPGPRKEAVVVFPSNREVDDEILDVLLPDADVAMVEAAGLSRPRPRGGLTLLSLDEQRAEFGADFPLIGHGAAACRNYGSWWAYRQGYEVIIHLDDDCYPGPDLVETYCWILNRGCEAVPLSSASGWVSPLHREDGGSEAGGPWYPRGFPYEERLVPGGHTQEEGEPRHVRPAVHLGLWEGVLDLSAVDKAHYANAGEEIPLVRRFHSAEAHVPVCAMNFAVRREWAPYVYQPPWARYGTTAPLQRYDDIIGGLLTLAFLRLGGLAFTFGPPYIDHRKKDGDLLAHAAAENLGNVLISRFARALSFAEDELLYRLDGDPMGTPKEAALRLLSELDSAGAGGDLEPIASDVSWMYRRWLGRFGGAA